MLFLLILIVLIVFADQLTKWLAVIYLRNSAGVDVIPGILRFEYTENRGMAFGMLDGHRWVFMILTTVVVIGLLIFLWRKPPKSKLCLYALVFIVGGGIGNMIDRCLLGYVIDFIYPCMIPRIWPWIFNVADSFVTVGTGMLMLYLILDLVREVRTERQAKALEKTGGTAEGKLFAPNCPEEDGEALISEPEKGKETEEKVGENDGRSEA